MSAQSGLTAAALTLAANGWRVFPCWPAGDRGKSPIAAAVPHGHRDATADPATIARWWARWPDALIGAPVPDPWIVLDIDPRHGGSRGALETAAGQRIPETLTVWSGRGDGGAHLYFRRPQLRGFTARNLPAGVDLKINGYCIMPPSEHPATGEPYTWEVREPVSLPSGFRRLLVPPLPAPIRPHIGSGGDDALVGFVAGQQDGNRNDALFWAACRAAAGGTLTDAAGELLAAGLATGQRFPAVRATINSAATRHGLGEIV